MKRTGRKDGFMRGAYIGMDLNRYARRRNKKPRICVHCGKEIPFGTPFIRYTRGKYHHECALSAGIRRQIA
jgi:hypothetical protein